jgi:hypothetical protein
MEATIGYAIPVIAILHHGNTSHVPKADSVAPAIRWAPFEAGI